MRLTPTKTKLELWFRLGHQGRTLEHLGIFPAQWKGWYIIEVVDDAKLGVIKSLMREAILFNRSGGSL